jgi:hypothetical protein
MRKFHRALIVMVVTATIAFQVAYSAAKGRGAAAAQGASSQVESLGSTKWASFVADIRRSEKGLEGLEVFSRYYQNSHGSIRTEAFSPDRKERVVTIHNHERLMSYFEGPRGDSAMLALEPRKTAQPKRMKIDTNGLSLVSEQRLGFTVYPYTSAAGRRSLLAPDLNLFSMFSELGNEREEVLAVTLQEPAAELFYPPATVKIRQATSINDLLRPFPNGR